MAVWENEIWPQNATRWTTNENTLKCRYEPRRIAANSVGYVDPTLRIDEMYLDSITYIWDKVTLNSLHEKIDLFIQKIKKQIYEAEVKKVRVEVIKKIIGGIPNFLFRFLDCSELETEKEIFSFIYDATSIFASILKSIFCNIDLFEVTKELTIGTYLGHLSQACYDYSKLENGVLSIYKYYVIKKIKGNIGNNSLKTTAYKQMTKFIPYGTVESSQFLHESDVIKPLQVNSDSGISYHGKITAFSTSSDFSSYVDGNNSGSSISKHNIHDFSQIVPYNEKYHKITCSCGLEQLIEHTFYYDGITCECDYCGTIQGLHNNNIDTASYPFASEYNLSPKVEYIKSGSGEIIETERLRCGVINNYLTLSAKSNDSDRAYIKYKFEKPITEITYQMGLWSDDESLIKNSAIHLDVFYENERHKIRDFSAKEMSTNKDALLSYTDILNIPSESFRIVVETNKVNNKNNRGRVVIGNISVKEFD